MKAEKIDSILQNAKKNNPIDLHDNSIRPIIGYLRDDIKAVILYGDDLILTEIGHEILNKNGWIKYNEWLTEIKKTELKKLKTDLTLAEKTLKEFPRTNFLAWGGFCLGALLLILRLIEWLTQQY